MLRAPRTLIPNEGYEIGWTRDRPFFNQPAAALIGPNGALINPATQTNPTNEYPWTSRGYTIVVPGNVNPNVPLLLEDNYRNLLLLQNNSRAISPDVAPDMFIALDGPVQSITINLNPSGTVTYAYNAITLQPGEGLLLDTRIFGNSLYFAWGASTNTNNSVGVFGMCVYGRTLNSPPQPPAFLSSLPSTSPVLQRFRPAYDRAG